MPNITAQMMLDAYAMGIFPMALDSQATELVWMEPRVRGVIFLDQFTLPRRLLRYMRASPLLISCNSHFMDTVYGCAETREMRRSTWINTLLLRLYEDLFHMGRTVSIEVWQLPQHDVDAYRDGSQPFDFDSNGYNKVLVGGVFGVTLGGIFVGESMFSKVPHASQFALTFLVKILRDYGYQFIDCQFHNDHLARFGCKQIKKDAYVRLLSEYVTMKNVPIEQQSMWARDLHLIDAQRSSPSNAKISLHNDQWQEDTPDVQAPEHAWPR